VISGGAEGQAPKAMPSEEASQPRQEVNPYSTVIFPGESVKNAVESALADARAQAADSVSKKSRKNPAMTIAGFMAYFAVQPLKAAKALPSWPSMPDLTDRIVLSADRAMIKSQSTCSLDSAGHRSRNGPGATRDGWRPNRSARLLDPSLLMETPPERALRPPKLWGEARPTSGGSDPDDHSPVPQIRRKRGRPGKSALPDQTEYVPKRRHRRERRLDSGPSDDANQTSVEQQEGASRATRRRRAQMERTSRTRREGRRRALLSMTCARCGETNSS